MARLNRSGSPMIWTVRVLLATVLLTGAVERLDGAKIRFGEVADGVPGGDPGDLPEVDAG
jgi:hypothetical protein